MSGTLIVAACGLTTIDVVQYVEALPQANEKVQSRSSTVDVGGPAANAAITTAALGVPCRLITQLGTSQIAHIASTRLRHYGLEVVDAAPESDWQPPVSTVLVNVGSGDRTIASTNSLGAPAPLLPEDALGGAKALLVDGHHLDLCLAMAERARAAGVPVLLDGGSWKPGLEKLLELVDAAVLSNDFQTPDCLPALEYGLWAGRPVAITNGPDPISFRIGDERGEIAVPVVDVVDTLGAGDVFHGAWLAFVGRNGLDRQSFPEGLAYAADIASRSCAQRGVRIDRG